MSDFELIRIFVFAYLWIFKSITCDEDSTIGAIAECQRMSLSGKFGKLHCTGIVKPERLKKAFEILKRQPGGLMMSAFTFEDSHVPALPMGLFRNMSLREIEIVGSDVPFLSCPLEEDKSVFQGVEDTMASFTVSKVKTVQNWDWSQLRVLKKLNLIMIQKSKFVHVSSSFSDWGRSSAVSSVTIRECRVHFVTTSAFAFPRLKTLDLSKNGIRFIEDGLFHEKCLLEKFDLSENNLEKLPEKLFAGLTELRDVNLKKNKLKILPEKLFIDLPKTLRVDLSNNELKTLNRAWFGEHLPNKIQAKRLQVKCVCELHWIMQNTTVCDECLVKWIKEVAIDLHCKFREMKNCFERQT